MNLTIDSTGRQYLIDNDLSICIIQPIDSSISASINTILSGSSFFSNASTFTQGDSIAVFASPVLYQDYEVIQGNLLQSSFMSDSAVAKTGYNCLFDGATWTLAPGGEPGALTVRYAPKSSNGALQSVTVGIVSQIANNVLPSQSPQVWPANSRSLLINATTSFTPATQAYIFTAEGLSGGEIVPKSAYTQWSNMNSFIVTSAASNVIGQGTLFDFADSTAALTFNPSSNSFS